MTLKVNSPQEEKPVRILCIGAPDCEAALLAIAGTATPAPIRVKSTASPATLVPDQLRKECDVVFFDVGVPETDGWEGVRRLRARIPDLPVVVVTDAGGGDPALHVVEAGVQDFVVRPLDDPGMLWRMIRYVMERFRSEQTLRRYRDHLETLVEARNAELKRANAQLRREVSERMRIEKELRESNMRLSQALTDLKRTEMHLIENERLRALGQMAAGIMNDFNNALMPVLGYSDLLLNNPQMLDDAVERLKVLHGINTAARRSAEEVRRLKEFYAPESSTVECRPVDLQRVIEDVVQLTRPRWKDEFSARNVRVDIVTDVPALAPVNGRESELKEAFTNIVMNALDAMPSGGKVTIRVRESESGVRLEFEDNGRGMSDDVRMHCFEPFFTTKGASGSGLGLSMVYGIVKSHNGHVVVSSSEGVGTTVTVRLPRFGPGVSEEEAVTRTGLRVLVIDDDEQVGHLVSRYLLSCGHKATVTASGGAGLAAFSEGLFDVVVTDRAMPDMSGDAVAMEIRRRDRRVPIIMLTGFGDLMKEAGIQPDGVDCVLSKPLTVEDLSRALARVTAGMRERCARGRAVPDPAGEAPVPESLKHPRASEGGNDR